MAVDVERFKKEHYARWVANGIQEMDLLSLISHLNHMLLSLKFIQDCEPIDSQLAMIDTLNAYRQSMCERFVAEYASGIDPSYFTNAQYVDEWIHQRLYS